MALLRLLFAEHEVLLRQLAPEGWAHSPYVRFFHPSPEQQHASYRRWIRRLSTLDGISQGAEPQKRPEDFTEDRLDQINEREEFLNVLGMAVYDLFSDGHQVINPLGKAYSLGSARGSGKFVADFFTYELEGLTRRYDYLDFYMGSVWINQRADLGPFYLYLFAGLREQGLDWIYHFPHLYLLDFQRGGVDQVEPVYYDPEQSLHDELRRLELAEHHDEFHTNLHAAYQDAWEDARRAPLVPIVAAYREVYGVIPRGHPWREG
jgi:hypothetical protein